ncbi:MAG TPA: hypothetical protein VMB27_19505 [Solirubrobacteraceae bacterium]|nr:hypothetical protein [Solirubrobacteraceae bacterium]
MSRGRSRTTHIAECFWPDVHEESVERAAERIKDSTAELTRAGTTVNLTSTIVLPRDEVVLYLFNGSGEAVRAACLLANVAFERIVEAFELEQAPAM